MAKPPAFEIDPDTVYRATVTTDRGTIVIDLDPALAPKTVNNFVSLARSGYYDGLTFHRVVDGVSIACVTWARSVRAVAAHCPFGARTR